MTRVAGGTVDLWLLVTAPNRISTDAEWPGAPAVLSSPDSPAMQEHVALDRLPERVPAGGEVEGWVDVRQAPARADRLIFGDITTDGHRTAGAAVLKLPPFD